MTDEHTEVRMDGGPFNNETRSVRVLIGGFPFSHYHENGSWYRWNHARTCYVYVGEDPSRNETEP